MNLPINYVHVAKCVLDSCFAPKYDTTPIYLYLYFPWKSRLFQLFSLSNNHLTHWGRVTHICVGNLTIIVSDNGLSPGQRQAIFWTNAGILLIRPLETNFSEIFIAIHTFSFKRMHLKMSSGKWRPSCFGLNVLTGIAYGSGILSASKWIDAPLPPWTLLRTDFLINLCRPRRRYSLSHYVGLIRI